MLTKDDRRWLGQYRENLRGERVRLLANTSGAVALLIALVLNPVAASDLSDEALLYSDLFTESKAVRDETGGHRWISFEPKTTEEWSDEQLAAMRATFKASTPKKRPAAVVAPSQSSGKPYSEIVTKYAQKFGLDPGLIHRVIQQESGYDPTAISSKGAKGLMQIMDALSLRFNINPFDPESNIKVGTRYLAGLLKRFGSIDLALAAYNAGPGTVDEYGGIPPYPETVNYVEKITASLASATGE